MMDKIFWLFACLFAAGCLLAFESLWFLLLCAPLALMATGFAAVMWLGSKALKGVDLW